MRASNKLAALLAVVVPAGVIVITLALLQVRAVPLNLYALILSVLTIVGSRFAIKMPGRSATVSVSEVFVFASLLLFGPAIATLTVAADGLLISFRHNNRRVYRAMFNVAEPAVSTWVAGSVFLALARSIPATGGVLSVGHVFWPVLGMATSFFLLNSGLTALAVAFESGERPLEVWSGHALQLAINFFAAASLAALATENGLGFNLQAIGLIVPLLVLSYVAYKEAATRVNEAERHVREVERLYEEARKRDDALRQSQKLEAIGRLAGGVAHDFNNMLTAIRGYGELVGEALAPGDPCHDDVAEIVKAADRAAGLTRQLLAFSRRQVVAPQVLALGRVVTGMEKMLHRLIGEDIVFQTVLAEDMSYVRIDPTQIEQVLLNLAVNARDAMPNGGTLRISLGNELVAEPMAAGVGTLPPGDYVRLSVADTGSGMTDDVVTHIFEPFFTTKEGSGTGLGLATVYGIVEQAQGAITIDTKVGRGTTFHVYLPASGVEADTQPTVCVLTQRRGAETILLVEDEPAVAAFVDNALTRAGYTVLRAQHAEHAIELARGHQSLIDLLLTDVVMPGMNGRELADRIGRTRPRTRVLFMSGYSDDVILRKGVQTREVEFLQKPFSIAALTMKVREVLATSYVAG